MGKRQRPNATGRTPTTRFARLDHSLLSSNAYRALTPNSRSLLTELTMMEDGKNNGKLYLSVRDAAARVGVSDLHAASAAFNQLQELGLIAATSEAHFAVKAGSGSRARCWRLTWLAWTAEDGKRHGPTNEWVWFEPEPGTSARRRMEAGQKALKRWRQSRNEQNFPVQESATRMPQSVADSASTAGITTPESVAITATQNACNGGKPRNSVVRDSATHTATQLGVAAIADPQTEPAAPEDLCGELEAALEQFPEDGGIEGQLASIFRAQGKAGLLGLAQTAGIKPPDRLVAHFVGNDTLNPTLVAHVRRALNSYQKEAA